jgi:hypothetical protein
MMDYPRIVALIDAEIDLLQQVRDLLNGEGAVQEKASRRLTSPSPAKNRRGKGRKSARKPETAPPVTQLPPSKRKERSPRKRKPFGHIGR